MSSYNPQEIEPRWQAKWAQDGLYRSKVDTSKQKYYALTMLPYPSGDLHIGHWYAMTPSDARARYMRMKGYNVLFPMGFDSFGLPAENAAIQRKIHPGKWTEANIERMRLQLRSMGAMFDWEREAVSSSPAYYRWTQWFFKKLVEMGMAYRKLSAVDFCPNCNTTLAREQVWGDDRHCERCKTPVIKKELEQWFFKITDYADELLDFSTVDWPERVRVMQTNWIGRSTGADVIFHTEGGDPLEIFTTRPDTLWGATFMVLAPEHPLVDKITSDVQSSAVSQYRADAARMSEIDRESADREKSGVFTGAYAINPVNGKRVPIWIADYVLMTYGSGAIMAVPAHDERDFQFAIKFGLPIVPVLARTDGVTKSFVVEGTMREGFAAALSSANISAEACDGGLCVTLSPAEVADYLETARKHLKEGAWVELVGAEWQFVFTDETILLDSVENEARILSRCHQLEPSTADKRSVMEMLWSCQFYQDVLYHHEHSTMIHSGEYSGTPGESAVKSVTDWLEANGRGSAAVNYRLRDWLISRQRYWGAPIPIIYCPEHGAVTVPDEDLPVILPDDVEFMPTGESPLKFHEEFIHTTCPLCGGAALRETDTMDTFMCSSWYQYRYLSPNFLDGPFDPAEGAYWLPVDQYTGGIEHATMHLIYTRFFTKAMREMGLVDFGEPMMALYNQGMVLGEDGEKMSKSRGNVVAPDNLVQQYGADTVRTYLMFFSRWDYGGPWNYDGIKGPQRLIQDIWDLGTTVYAAAAVDEEATRNLRRKTHQVIQKVTEDFERFSFNTAVAAIMELRNFLLEVKKAANVDAAAWREAINALILLLAPIAPHVSEELWAHHGHKKSVHTENWPTWDPETAKEDSVTLVVQINGRVRDKVTLPAGSSDELLKETAMSLEKIQGWLEGNTPRKVIVVKGKLVNIVL